MEEKERQTDRKGNATSTRANEEHVKEFEGSSETIMKEYSGGECGLSL
jgi:hypothetical protein